jgi:DNA-binding CsgD family transcriptional regulator
MTLALTKREAQLLTKLTEGHSLESAAAALEMNYQVAKNHLRSARTKNQTNTFGLVAQMALRIAQRGASGVTPRPAPGGGALAGAAAVDSRPAGLRRE